MEDTMRCGKISTLIALLAGLAGGACLSILYATGWRAVEVHTLEFPMLLAGPDGNGPFQLLPLGTTLYLDQTYPEGFTRYKIYVNVDRFPLKTTKLSDPTAIIPVTAFPMDKDDVKRLLERNPVTKEELTSILKSGVLPKAEIRELLAEYAKQQ
jgi:hypothetical protein